MYNPDWAVSCNLDIVVPLLVATLNRGHPLYCGHKFLSNMVALLEGDYCIPQ